MPYLAKPSVVESNSLDVLVSEDAKLEQLFEA
jgi:hypothetical protein